MNRDIAKRITGIALIGLWFNAMAEPGSEPSDPGYSLPTVAAMNTQSPGASFDHRPIRARVTAVRQTVISAELNGSIQQLSVAEGNAFKRGDVLVKVDCGIYQAQQDKVRADLDSAISRHKAIKRLAELESKGSLELELAEIEMRKARADFEMNKTQVAHCVIKAPFDGSVSEKHVDEQQYVQTGTPLLKIIDDSLLQVEFIAPSRYLRWLKVGAPFQLTIDETGRTYQATVERFGADVDAVSQSIKVFAELKNQHHELLSGMSGLVTLINPQTNRVTRE
jgi:membrane fusion protein, multidrug efflux system